MRGFLLALFTVGVAACSHGERVEPTIAGGLEAAITARATALPHGEGIALRYLGPERAAEWAQARGADVDPGSSIRIASITKTFVAATTLRMVEDGHWKLDDPIAPYLPSDLASLLRADGYDIERMTIRMLLNHTSGLHDYAEDPGFRARVFSDPGHIWTRQEQIALAMEAGAPLAAPGAHFAYSDTGYILLGAMIEHVSGQSLPNAVRTYLRFAELGLQHTWFETLENEPRDEPERARQFVDEFDGSGIHPSVDLYGGGGLVSTLDDLTVFFRALIEGKVVGRAMLAAMTTPSAQSLEAGSSGYGLGLSVRTLSGVACYGHGGFWGVVVWYCPSVDIAIAGFVTNTAGRDLLSAMIEDAAAKVRH